MAAAAHRRRGKSLAVQLLRPERSSLPGARPSLPTTGPWPGFSSLIVPPLARLDFLLGPAVPVLSRPRHTLGTVAPTDAIVKLTIC